VNAFESYAEYLSSSRYDPVPYKEERKLLIEYSSGSLSAYNRLVESNLRFVVYALRDYKIPDNVEVMDVIQEGNLGLMEGVKRFKYERYKNRVFTFCFYYIRLFINVFLRNETKSYSVFTRLPNNDFLDDSFSVDPNYYEQIAADIVTNSFDKLDAREKVVMIYFFGLTHPFTPRTLQEIASMLNVSVELIRRIRNKALDKLNLSEFHNDSFEEQ